MVSMALHGLTPPHFSVTSPNGTLSLLHPALPGFLSVAWMGQFLSASGTLFFYPEFSSSPCEWMAAAHPHSFRLNVTSPLCPSLPPLKSPPHPIILSRHLFISFLAHLQFVSFLFSYLLSRCWWCFVFSVPLTLPPECKLTREGGLLRSSFLTLCLSRWPTGDQCRVGSGWCCHYY